MAERPSIKPYDWIVVGNTKCVVCNVREPDDPLGDAEVVCTPDKPANVDVRWNGSSWEFAKIGDYGGYAERYPRLSLFVAQLRRGN